MDVICFEKIYDLPTAPDGYWLSARSVANDQSVLFLFVELAGKDDVAETFKQGIGIFPRPKMRTQRRFCLLKVTGGIVGQDRVARTRAPDRSHLGNLDKGRFGKPQEVRLVLPDGSGISEGQLLGRGRHLYFFDTSSAYRASLE
jgi:hypothetical protein